MNIRLSGTFALRSPLSHIGESISTTSYLSEEPILQADGSAVSVFTYSGNAWRGQLRDLCATYMLEHIGSPTISLDAFHLLFSGGRIGGEQSIDLTSARAWRKTIPMLAIFGGGVGNQILPGKLRVRNAYPVCREAIPVLPPSLREAARARSYRGMTFEKSFSRKDDAKDDRLNGHLVPPPAAQPSLLSAGGDVVDEARRAKGKGKAPGLDAAPVSDQMRVTCELLAAGVVLATEIDALDVTEIELGALVSGLHLFSRSPHIGGQANKGHGLVALDYTMIDLDTGETRPFLSVDGGPALLAAPAAAAKDAYDQHLRHAYDQMLAAQGHEMARLIGA